MIYKFLSLLFFCGVCVSAFGQELQSPQINQNAIFANPGLAGSKGHTRICTALSRYHSKYFIWNDMDSSGHNNDSYSNRKIHNGLVSIDGLIMKNTLGIAGYIKNESFQRINSYNSYQNNILTNTRSIKYEYTNIYMGFMLAPKFHLTAQKTNKQDHVLSPAVAIGFKGTQFDYSGPSFYNPTTKDTIKDGSTKSSLGLDYVSLSLLYSSPKSYLGIKLNFKNYINEFLLYNVSFVYAKTYSNKKVKDSKFSFTPQFQLTIPTYGFYKLRYNSYFDNMNMNNLNSYFNMNLDFRYGKVIFGNFIGATDYIGFYAGFTGGIQLANTKIVVNYSPRLGSNKNGSSGLFISANFILKPKSSTYR